MICPYCNSPVELGSSLKVYSQDYGNLWICSQYPKCDAYVGCHKGTDTPLGRLANKELREWKRKAHGVFDELWKRKLAKRRKERGADYKQVYARGSGYKWLREQLGIEAKDCHIGMFDIDMCQRVVALCLPYSKKKKT